MNNNKLLRLYHSTYSSVGYRRGVLLDGIRGDSFFVDLKTLESSVLELTEVNFDPSDDFHKVLVDTDLAFVYGLEIGDNMPRKKPRYYDMALLNNVLVEVNQDGNKVTPEDLVGLVNHSLCKHITIFCNSSKIPSNYLKDLLLKLDNSVASTIELIFPNFDKRIAELAISLSKVVKITFYKSVEFGLEESDGVVLIKIPNEIPNYYSDKDRKHWKHFNINTKIVQESFEYHTYFNKKVFLNSLGYVSNAPESFSDKNFPFSSIFYEIINDKSINKEITKNWYVKKDLTDVCSHCEFRSICVDNRLPKERKRHGKWYHTTECNYNPYISKWKWEEGYSTLAECGVKSDETDFKIDHERIAAINTKLWGDKK